MISPLKRGGPRSDPERKAKWRGAGLLTRAARGSKPPGSANSQKRNGMNSNRHFALSTRLAHDLVRRSATFRDRAQGPLA